MEGIPDSNVLTHDDFPTGKPDQPNHPKVTLLKNLILQLADEYDDKSPVPHGTVPETTQRVHGRSKAELLAFIVGSVKPTANKGHYKKRLRDEVTWVINENYCDRKLRKRVTNAINDHLNDRARREPARSIRPGIDEGLGTLQPKRRHQFENPATGLNASRPIAHDLEQTSIPKLPLLTPYDRNNGWHRRSLPPHPEISPTNKRSRIDCNTQNPCETFAPTIADTLNDRRIFNVGLGGQTRAHSGVHQTITQIRGDVQPISSQQSEHSSILQETVLNQREHGLAGHLLNQPINDEDCSSIDSLNTETGSEWVDCTFHCSVSPCLSSATFSTDDFLSMLAFDEEQPSVVTNSLSPDGLSKADPAGFDEIQWSQISSGDKGRGLNFVGLAGSTMIDQTEHRGAQSFWQRHDRKIYLIVIMCLALSLIINFILGSLGVGITALSFSGNSMEDASIPSAAPSTMAVSVPTPSPSLPPTTASFLGNL